MADPDGEEASTNGDEHHYATSAELIPVWRLPIFGDKIHRPPAFLVPRLTAMANELPGTDLDRRIYALHQGCALGDVAFAARLPPEHIIAVGKRTIRGTRWLEQT